MFEGLMIRFVIHHHDPVTEYLAMNLATDFRPSSGNTAEDRFDIFKALMEGSGDRWGTVRDPGAADVSSPRFLQLLHKLSNVTTMSISLLSKHLEDLNLALRSLPQITAFSATLEQNGDFRAQSCFAALQPLSKLKSLSWAAHAVEIDAEQAAAAMIEALQPEWASYSTLEALDLFSVVGGMNLPDSPNCVVLRERCKNLQQPRGALPPDCVSYGESAMLSLIQCNDSSERIRQLSHALPDLLELSLIGNLPEEFGCLKNVRYLSITIDEANWDPSRATIKSWPPNLKKISVNFIRSTPLTDSFLKSLHRLPSTIKKIEFDAKCRMTPFQLVSVISALPSLETVIFSGGIEGTKVAPFSHPNIRKFTAPNCNLFRLVWVPNLTRWTASVAPHSPLPSLNGARFINTLGLVFHGGAVPDLATLEPLRLLRHLRRFDIIHSEKKIEWNTLKELSIHWKVLSSLCIHSAVSGPSADAAELLRRLPTLETLYLEQCGTNSLDWMQHARLDRILVHCKPREPSWHTITNYRLPFLRVISIDGNLSHVSFQGLPHLKRLYLATQTHSFMCLQLNVEKCPKLARLSLDGQYLSVSVRSLPSLELWLVTRSPLPLEIVGHSIWARLKAELICESARRENEDEDFEFAASEEGRTMYWKPS
jgi:hypothetical protein